MSNKLFTYTAIALTTIIVAGGTSFANASNHNGRGHSTNFIQGTSHSGFQTGTGMRNSHRKTKKIDTNVDLTDSGVSITRTTSDETALIRLLEEAKREKSITRNISNTNSGTIETIVSTNDTVVSDLQAQTVQMQKKVERMKHKKSVDISIVNVSGGIQITTIASNDKMLKALHKKATEQNAITREITLLENGVRTNLSSKDRDVVKSIQEGNHEKSKRKKRQ